MYHFNVFEHGARKNIAQPRILLEFHKTLELVAITLPRKMATLRHAHLPFFHNA